MPPRRRAVDESVVRDKLNWESSKIALTLTGGSRWQRMVWLPERVLAMPRRLLGIAPFGPEQLEPEGGVTVRPDTPLNLFR